MMKVMLIIAGRLVALTALYIICFATVSAALLRSPAEQSEPTQAGVALAALLVVGFLNTVVLGYLILRSRWAGWKLALTIFVVMYGVTTVMGQIETAFFVTRLPPGMPRLFLSGAIIAALFSPLAVLILGKRRPGVAEMDSHPRLNMPVGEWVGKLTLIVIAYVVMYFAFGYFIAWKSAAVRAYYGGSDPGSFFAQLRVVVRNTPWLLPLQAARAILWAAIAVPVIRMNERPVVGSGFRRRAVVRCGDE